MAATSHPTATLVALDVLKAGGHAMDAAIAACATQCVVEPGSTGIGGDCFAMIAPEATTNVVAYNGSGRTPAGVTLAMAGDAAAIERQSPLAITVPGAVEAWERLLRDHGRMSLAEILAPAIELAHNGYPVTPRVAYDTMRARDLLLRDAQAAATFLIDGEAPAIGTLQRQPRLAETLKAIAAGGSKAFYQGEIAADMLERLAELGGVHTAEDFAATAGEYVEPIHTRFRGRTVFEIPPNGQGIVALLIMNILSRLRPKPDPLHPENLHIEIEATRLAYAARDALVADMGHGHVPVEEMLSDRLADELAARIDLGRALGPMPDFTTGIHHDTVYISVVDRDRNCVSFINSLFHGYGSGIMTKRTGIMFHNRGESFSLTPGHPNVLAPRRRPMHTIIPGMAAQGDRIDLVFGVMGGHYQAMGHAHLLAKLYDHGLDLQSAIDLPRLFPQPGSGAVEMEARLLGQVGEELAGRGFTVQSVRSPIGGAQAIAIDWERGILQGGSDPRKDGCALGI